MNKTYLINYTLLVEYYRNMSYPKAKKLMRIVNANSEQEAIDKLAKFYEDQNDPYYKTHSVNIIFVTESI